MSEPIHHNLEGSLVDAEKANTWGYISLLGLIALLLLPPALLIWGSGVIPAVILWGACVWAGSLAVKQPLAATVSRKAGSSLSEVTAAAIQGLISSICELGAAAFYFLCQPLPGWNNVLAFGVGAGCAEVGYVLLLGIKEGIRSPSADVDAAWLAGARCSLCVRYSVPLERFLALIGHASSRGLVYAGISIPRFGGGILCLSVLLFAAIDGVSYYGSRTQWDWNSPRLCRRFYCFVGAISLFEAAALLALAA